MTGAKLKQIAALVPDDAIARFHHPDMDSPGEYLTVALPSDMIVFDQCDYPNMVCYSIELTTESDETWELDEEDTLPTRQSTIR